MLPRVRGSIRSAALSLALVPTITACASAPRPLTPWYPIASDSAPAHAWATWDREQFLRYTADIQARQRELAAQDRQVRWVMDAMGVVYVILAIQDVLAGESYSLWWTSAATAIATARYLARREARRRDCVRFLAEMVPPFTQKWARDPPPLSDLRWSEYRQDQQLIVAAGGC